MIGGPVVQQPVLARRPGKQCPTRAAAQRRRKASEFRAPALERAEVARQADAESRRLAGWFEFAVAAEAGEIEFVQSHRVGRDQLLALEAVQAVDGRVRPIDCRELGADRMQPLDGAAVVVLVMGLQQAFRKPAQFGRIKRQGKYRNSGCVHGSLLKSPAELGRTGVFWQRGACVPRGAKDARNTAPLSSRSSSLSWLL